MKLNIYAENSKKVLHKAQDLYVRNVGDCANMVGYLGCLACPTVCITCRKPQSFSDGYQRVIDYEFVEAYRNMIKARLGTNRDNKYSKEEKDSENIDLGPDGRTKIYSISLGGLARIDEDQPCCFDHEPVCSRTAA